MTQKQRLLTVLMTLMLSVTGAWALDGSGTNSDPYQLGSVQDWKDFAAIVNNGTNPAANAKMTADIDLGTDATMVGNANTNPYQGVFNGQGHKLTVNWTVNGGGDGVAPFRYIDGATIQKLHVDGSISATGSKQRAAASLAAYSIGDATSTISECWSSASITGYDTMGGIFGVANGTSTVNITDCLFTGSIHPTNEGEGCCAGFASQAMKDGSNVPTINITRGLYLGSYTGSTVRCYNFVRNDFPDWFGVHTVTDCYYKNVYGTAQGTQASNDNLADGTTTTALNNGRTGDDAVWVQQGSQPILKTFAVKTDASGAYLIGSVDDWKAFADIVNSGSNTAANAKMTVDIDLGTDQTRIGSKVQEATAYSGTFDGQGHTLTVAYVETGGYIASPFTQVVGATIKNLHVAGSIQSAFAFNGLIGLAREATPVTVSNVWMSATISCTFGGSGWCGAIIGSLMGTPITITDCLFTGSITCTTANGCLGCFVGDTYSGSASISNCLSTGTFTYSGAEGFTGTHSNCFVKTYPVAYPAGVTQPTDAELSNSTTTTALNAGRTGDDVVWVQQGSQPMLKTFAVKTDASGAYLIGSVGDWIGFSNIVATTQNANAKMTADVNLGSNQSHIGSMEEGGYAFSGTFDGQGHTLTVAYVGSASQLVSPFSKINGATIKNLHVAGSIQSTFAYVGVVGFVSGGTVNISNVWMSADFSTTTGQADLAAIVGGSSGYANVTISDCLYTGSMSSTGSACGCFLGFYNSGTVIMNNCLATGSYTYTHPDLPGSYSNCYIKSYPISLVTGITQPTGENLSDGTTTTALNNGRKNGPWVQDADTGEPRLDLFMATTSLTANEGKTGEYWSTYYDGAKSSIADANTTVYTGKVNGDKIDLTEIVDKTIPAGNAVILKSTAANVTLTKTSATGTLANNDLKGVDVATAKTDVYCLSKNGTVVGFYKFTGDVPAHRAYIEIVSSAPMLGFDDGGTTEIMTLNIEHGTLNNGSWYTLDGRQLNAQPTRKGIYVRNGKKFIVK